MTAATKDYTITRGETFNRTVRWGAGNTVFKPVSSVTPGAPCALNVPGHGLTDGWPFSVSGVTGTTDLNGGPYQATVVDPDNLQISDLDGSSFRPYKSGGVVSYNAPVDLTRMTARLDIRRRLSDPAPLVELTTENGGISLDPVLNTINFTLTSDQTTALAAATTTGVYALYLYAGTVATPLLSGNITLVTEAVQ